MPSTPPEGEPAPRDGRLPADALRGIAQAPWGIYVHVPFCRVRCGYCDFNTYTPAELAVPTASASGSPRAGTTTGDYPAWAVAELDLAARVLGSYARPVETVFIGGGTPTLLAATQLGEILDAIRERFGIADRAEITTEANPDTVDDALAADLAEAGFTRVSLGMQSSVPHVLRTLDRTHQRENVARAVRAVRAAGLSVSLDLIYGTPGESLDDWRRSLTSAVELEPDHVSAYALVVEEGTRLARQVRSGLVPAPTDDDEADKYELADEVLADAGFAWYEVSNWARRPQDSCRHNIGYWRGGSWWGVGPGAHSHVCGVRWWNVRHPARYAQLLAAGESTGEGREVLTDEQRYEEAILLGIRLAEGLWADQLRPVGRAAIPGLVDDGLITVDAPSDRLSLTLRGRLLADAVVRRLLGF